jgi:MOSC domain-containing protein YiiM
MQVALTLTGIVAGVYLGVDRESLITTQQSEASVNLDGFVGDKHSGVTRKSDSRTPYHARGTVIRNERQVTIVACEELAQVAAALNIAEIRPQWLGANLALQGIPHLSQLPPSTRIFCSGGAVLVVQEENLPCIAPGKVISRQYGRSELESQFVKAALHKRGLTACVERPGVIREGDEVKVLIPYQHVYSPEESG